MFCSHGIILTERSLFQAFGWWGAGKKLGRRRKIDEGKNRAGKGRERRFLAPAPVSPRFFPLVFLFALAAHDLTCSPLSKRLEPAIQRFHVNREEILNGSAWTECLVKFSAGRKFVWCCVNVLGVHFTELIAFYGFRVRRRFRRSVNTRTFIRIQSIHSYRFRIRNLRTRGQTTTRFI